MEGGWGGDYDFYISTFTGNGQYTFIIIITYI